MLLQAQDETIKFSQTEVKSAKPCNAVNLPDLEFELGGGLIARIPQLYFTRDIDEGCLLLI